MIKRAPVRDHVDQLRAQWRHELPDLDTEPMSVMGRVYHLSHLASGPITACFAEHGLGRGEFDVLGTLRRAGPPFRLTPTELYRTLMISSGGLTDRLRRLEDAGLVTREASDEDSRSIAVRLTEKGRRTVETAFRADMELEASMMSALSARERTQLGALLRKLIAGFSR